MAAMKISYRIGVMPGPWPDDADTRGFLWKLVDLCERSPIDSLWFSERLSSPIPVPEPITTMAAIAARTERLKFGPSVLTIPFRTPVVLARELAMIDALSNGRLLPAIGIGAEDERSFRAAGVPMRERARRSFHRFVDMLPKDAKDVRLLGTSGTVTTLASVHLELPSYDRRAVDGLHVPVGDMRRISTLISELDLSGRSALPCIGADRADMVVAGCAILEAILDIWPAERLGIADRGIREGILRSLMARDGHQL